MSACVDAERLAECAETEAGKGPTKKKGKRRGLRVFRLPFERKEKGDAKRLGIGFPLSCALKFYNFPPSLHTFRNDHLQIKTGAVVVDSSSADSSTFLTSVAARGGELNIFSLPPRCTCTVYPQHTRPNHRRSTPMHPSGTATNTTTRQICFGLSGSISLMNVCFLVVVRRLFFDE